MLAKGRESLLTDAGMGLYSIKSALRLRAAVLVKAQSSEAEDAIRKLANDSEALHAEHSVPIAPTEKNDILVLALAVGDLALAQRIACLPASMDEYFFTNELTALLLKAMGMASSVEVGKTAKAEELLLSDLRLVASGQPTDLSATDKFWSATRRRRYANTIHEHRNFFRAALATLQGR